MSTPNLKYAARAPFWNQFEGQTAVPGPPVDNAYQETALDTSGYAINTIKSSGARSRTLLDNPGGTAIVGALTTPAAPTVAATGGSGSTWTYKVVAKMTNGTTTAASSAGSTAVGAATLSSTAYNTVSFTSVAEATSYDIYRTVAATSPTSTGKIGTVTLTAGTTVPVAGTTLTFADTGQAGDTATAPTVNTTGVLEAAKIWDFTLTPLAAPQVVTVTPAGTAGVTTYSYVVAALTAAGSAAPASAASTTTGNASLSTTNYNVVAWLATPGAVSYNVYRSVGGSDQGLLGNVLSTAALVFNDTGIASDSTTAPTVNTTGVLDLTNPQITTGIRDANGNTILGFTATTSAVNYVNLTDTATGNPPLIASTGSDTNVGITVNTKGTGAITLAPGAAGGTIVIGKTDQTGAITVGSSSGTESVLIGNGAGVSTVSVGNATTAGSTVNLAGAATATGITDTVNIATGNTVGTGSKVVHIADGTPAGTNLVTIGSNANTANTTTIQGGNGTAAIALTPQTTGTIVIGAAAGTGVIGVGTSSATQVVNVGNGAGVSTVNLANTSVAGANVNMATAVTGAGITDTVAISTGNAAATGVKVVNIATGVPGTSGNNKVTIGGGATSAVTLNAVVTSYQAVNYQGTEGGANNAITFNLTDAGGNAVTLAAGLRITVKLAHSLQAGANTAVLNGAGGTKSIKKHTNPANDIGTAYVSGSIIDICYDGTVWQDMAQ